MSGAIRPCQNVSQAGCWDVGNLVGRLGRCLMLVSYAICPPLTISHQPGEGEEKGLLRKGNHLHCKLLREFIIQNIVSEQNDSWGKQLVLQISSSYKVVNTNVLHRRRIVILPSSRF